MNFIKPACSELSVAGSIRRKCEYVSDIDIVCVPIHPISVNALFPEGYQGMIKNGNRMKSFHYNYGQYGVLKIELYITTIDNFGRILAIRTGSSAFAHLKIMITANRMGFCGTEDGLRRKKECIHKGSKWIIKPEFKDNPTLPPPFTTEEAFFQFLNIPWIRPEDRNWISQKRPELNYAI